MFVFPLLLPFRSTFLAPPREQRPYHGVEEIKGRISFQSFSLFQPLKRAITPASQLHLIHSLILSVNIY